MKPGSVVAQFEKDFAQHVGAEYAIALCNGTATLHTALIALGVQPGDRVAVPPLTMSSTTIAVLYAGAVPVFHDVDPKAWLMVPRTKEPVNAMMPVSLYGLHSKHETWGWNESLIDDAAQTLRSHSGCAFTSYSFQASKILSCGEGGALVTNDKHLAQAAREFSSLGYRMRPDQPRIDPAVLKSPTYERHHTLGYNYRMSDPQAHVLLDQMADWDHLLDDRQRCAALYREAIKGCAWLTPQFVPDGWTHDYWTFAVATDTPDRALKLASAMETHQGERPYFAWLPAYQEPALRHLAPDGTCPVAESLQPRLLQFQCNDVASAMTNTRVLSCAIAEIG